MRIVLLLFVTLVSGLPFAGGAEVEGKQTPELAALQGRYKAEVQAAMKSIQDRYLSQYEALIRSFTTRGDLAAAVAVQEEIAAMKKTAAVETAGVGANATKRELEKEVVGHWTWGSPKVWLGIRQDGKAYLPNSTVLWTVNSEKAVVLTDPLKPSIHATLVFDARVESFTGTDFEGKRISGVRRDRD